MKVTALAGGVGGAKLADGLYRTLPPHDLTIIVNTGDDFEHWGLKICPDLDTVCYTLARLANPETGWGRREETWQAFEQVRLLGGADWFRLGDKDLATHLLRTEQLRAERTLSQVTKQFCAAWGIACQVLPMTDDAFATVVQTVAHGDLPFQEYFVHQRCEPAVRGFLFDGSNTARPTPGVHEAIAATDVILFCPSNPWVSLDPILALTTTQIAASPAKKVAVSPIIAGATIKGPAAKMYRELGIDPSALAVARHYQHLLDGFVIDRQDASLKEAIESLGMQVLVTDTIMKNEADRERLAQDVLHFVQRNLA